MTIWRTGGKKRSNEKHVSYDLVPLTGTGVGLPSLKSCERTKLKGEVEKINITEMKFLMYAAVYVTTEGMGMIKGRKGRRTEELFWKKRIKGNIKTWRKDLSKIEVRRGNMRLRQGERERLNRKYHLGALCMSQAC